MKIPIKVLILQLTLNANERTVVREAIEFLSSNNLDSTFTKSRPFLLWKEKLSTFDPYSKGVLFHDIIDKNRYDEYYGPVETDKQVEATHETWWKLMWSANVIKAMTIVP